MKCGNCDGELRLICETSTSDTYPKSERFGCLICLMQCDKCKRVVNRSQLEIALDNRKERNKLKGE